MQSVHRLVEENGAKLLLVALCGSRSFGYAAPQSDYDLRFLYVYPESRYFSINPVQSELRIKDADVVGYELGKFLAMAAGNGWTAPEMLRSPLWYTAAEFPDMVGELAHLCQSVFTAAPAVRSLLSCAKTYGKRLAHLRQEEQNNPDTLVKMNLGRLRVLLAALYLQRHGCFYPVLLRDLAAATCPSIVPAVEVLTEWRAGQAEPTPQVWFGAMAAVRALIEEVTDFMAQAEPLPTSVADTAPLDAFYLRVVQHLRGK